MEKMYITGHNLLKNKKMLISFLGKMRDQYAKYSRIAHLFLASEVPFKFVLRKDIYFAHGVGIAIAKRTVIGSNVTIYQNVTLTARHGKQTTIGDGVIIYANCVLLGVEIGKNSRIGAGSVVTKNIPPNEIWAGNPAKKIRGIYD